ncbi:MAG: FmdB family zinc ribbon protein [Armatimonadota bacterium]
MPIYEYECDCCGETFDLLVRRSKANGSPPCEMCGSEETRRIMSGFFGRSGSGDGESSESVGGACAGCSAASCAGCKAG